MGSRGEIRARAGRSDSQGDSDLVQASKVLGPGEFSGSPITIEEDPTPDLKIKKRPDLHKALRVAGQVAVPEALDVSVVEEPTLGGPGPQERLDHHQETAPVESIGDNAGDGAGEQKW